MAEFGCALGHVLPIEEGQLAETLNLGAFLADQPHQHIHVVAVLCQNDRAAGFAVAPIAAHIAVAHVGVADARGKHDLNDIADPTVVNQLLDQTEEGREAQHMADAHEYALFIGRFRNLHAFLGRRRDRLFQHDVVALFNRQHGRLKVHLILRGDDGQIRHARLSEQLPEIIITGLIRHAMHLLNVIAPHRIGVGNGDQFKFRTGFFCMRRISGSAVACADQYGANFLFSAHKNIPLPLFSLDSQAHMLDVDAHAAVVALRILNQQEIALLVPEIDVV